MLIKCHFLFFRNATTVKNRKITRLVILRWLLCQKSDLCKKKFSVILILDMILSVMSYKKNVFFCIFCGKIFSTTLPFLILQVKLLMAEIVKITHQKEIFSFEQLCVKIFHSFEEYKIFQWKKRGFQLCRDSSPDFSIPGRLLQ